MGASPPPIRPILRKLLAALGRPGPAGGTVHVIDEVVRAAASLAQQRVGAVIVLERGTPLTEYIESGVRIDGVVSRRLLESLFQPRGPLRDGAAIISGGRLAAAACPLPVAPAGESPAGPGPCQGAALALTLETDAAAVVVCEQDGTISLAAGGALVMPRDAEDLRHRLRELAGHPAAAPAGQA